MKQVVQDGMAVSDKDERPSLLDANPEVFLLSREQVAILQRAREAWPNVRVPQQPFVDYVTAILGQQARIGAAFQRLAIDDLYLAYACSIRNPEALRTFARSFDDEMRAVAARLRLTESDRDDVRQTLWNKLFVESADSRIRILDYRGTGRLRHWYRVLATRACLDLLREQKRQSSLKEGHDVDVLGACAPNTDPSVAGIRRRYNVEFREALERAFLSLDVAERNALRCHFLMGLTIDQLAATFGVHRATAARRINRALEHLRTQTRAHLMKQLSVETHEMDSVMRLLDSELSVSLSRLLRAC